MKKYWIDLNSFEVEAENEEEAKMKAEKMLKDDPSIAYPLDVNEQ